MFLLYRNYGERHYGFKPLPPHPRKVWAFQVILEGSCSLLVRENNVTQEKRLLGPVLTVAGPDCMHSWGGTKDDVCRIAVFHFDEAYPILCSVIGRTGYRCVKIAAAELPLFEALYDRCGKARRAAGFVSTEAHTWYVSNIAGNSDAATATHLPPLGLLDTSKRSALLSPLIYSIVAAELTIFFLRQLPQTELSPMADFGENKVAEALAWYEANLASGPTIKEVAHAVYLSATHLRRLFQKVRGISPQTAFTRVQFERAKWLMRDLAMPFERISEVCGFGSASAFSRAFKAEFGSSPREYRDKLRGDAHASSPVTKAEKQKGRSVG